MNMPDFRFKRLEKYKVGGTGQKMELRIPLPQTPSGKIYRWCPNNECTPRLFLLCEAQVPETLDATILRRPPGTNETTCPYCGMDSQDDDFNYQGDIEAIKKYIEWAASREIEDYFEKMTKDFNRSQPRGGFVKFKMDFKAHHEPEPRAWREDLIRNLACDICGREYGVYAIALFCPDCGSRNLHVHFEREVELIIQQIDLAEQIAETDNNELSYRILGNSHEDVVTVFETYQKLFYKYEVRKLFPKEKAKEMISKGAIGNRFQNIRRANEMYNVLSIDPFNVLNANELEVLKLNIEKRHVIGHNLSMADEAYSEISSSEKPGTTVQIIAEDISEFVQTVKKVVIELERLL